MINIGIAQKRLFNQHISKPVFSKPEEVVGWLGAVQAQDYFGAKWALGIRMQSAVDNDIEQAFTNGSILRTHVLRPTWHFVTPTDIRWLLMLTAPRVRTASAYMCRKHGLDRDLFQRSNKVLVKALQLGKNLTRDELKAVLAEAGITTDDGDRLAYLMMNAELDGLICSGPRQGNQFTYALLEERASQAKVLSREEALVELSRRYFNSRGPATIQDFAKWSGLMISDCKIGLDSIKSQFVNENINGQTYWLSSKSESNFEGSPSAYLLSVYDEYVSGYKDRSAVSEEEVRIKLSALGNGLNNVIVIDGQIIGSWTRILKKHSIVIKINPFFRLNDAEKQAIITAAQKYADFFQLSGEIIQADLRS